MATAIYNKEGGRIVLNSGGDNEYVARYLSIRVHETSEPKSVYIRDGSKKSSAYPDQISVYAAEQGTVMPGRNSEYKVIAKDIFPPRWAYGAIPLAIGVLGVFNEGFLFEAPRPGYEMLVAAGLIWLARKCQFRRYFPKKLPGI